jgi:hypothetical protein
MFNKLSPKALGFLQATGIALYLLILATFFFNIENLFQDKGNEFFAPIIMLLLFMMSAVITSTIFLGRSIMLFWNKKYQEAFTLLGWTLCWTFVYFMFFVTINLSL